MKGKSVGKGKQQMEDLNFGHPACGSIGAQVKVRTVAKYNS